MLPRKLLKGDKFPFNHLFRRHPWIYFKSAEIPQFINLFRSLFQGLQGNTS